MPALMMECPKCSKPVEVNPSAEIACCRYCETKIILNEEHHKIDFRLSDYISEDLLPNTDGALPEILFKDEVEFLVYANGLISERNSYSGWFYRGACLIAKGTVQEGMWCWARSVDLCDDADRLKKMYGYMLSILVNSKIQLDHDKRVLFNEDYVKYNGLKCLDFALTANGLIEYKRYDVFYDLIDTADSLSGYDLIAGEQHSLTDVFEEIFYEALKSYSDFYLLLDIIKRSIEIERRTVLRLARYYDFDNPDRYKDIDPSTCSMDDLLKVLGPFMDEYDKGYDRSFFASVIETTIHHYIHERLEYHRGQHSAEELSSLGIICRTNQICGYIEEYRRLRWFSSLRDSYSEFQKEQAEHELRAKVYSIIDKMIALIPNEGKKGQKRRLFGRRG